MHIYHSVEEKAIKLYFVVFVRNILIYSESRDSIPSRMAAYSLNVSLGRHLKQICSSIGSESIFLHDSRQKGFYDGALVEVL